MAETGWLAAAAALSFIGMAWLALAMDGHWTQVMQRPADAMPDRRRRRRLLRGLGWMALALALFACLRVDHPSMAVLVWMMLQAAAVPGVALMLTRRPRSLRLLWPWGWRG